MMDIRPVKRQRRWVLCSSDDEADIQVGNGSSHSKFSLGGTKAVGGNAKSGESRRSDSHSRSTSTRTNLKTFPLSSSPSRPKQPNNNKPFSQTSSNSHSARGPSSSSPEKNRKGRPGSNGSLTGKSLHNYFQSATEEQRWSSKRFEAEQRPLASLTEGIEDDDDLIEDDYDSYDEIFTQHILNGKVDADVNVGSKSGLDCRSQCPQSSSRQTTINHSKKTSTSAKRFLLPPSPHLRNTNRAPQISEVKDDDNRPWAQRYAPSDLDELAVHKKKVADVRNWLDDVFTGRNRRRLLVLRGPAGCGKTTTISSLSKSVGFDIVEWKNPSAAADFTAKGYTSVGVQFEEFLGRADKFGGLALDGAVDTAGGRGNRDTYTSQRRILLVEEFPTILSRNSSGLAAFRSSLQRYLTAAVSPLSKDSGRQESPPIVIIVSETLLSSTSSISDNFTVHRLLGPDIYNNPDTTIIDFNSIAPTLMYKALKLVLEKEARRSRRTRIPGPTVLERISEIGDIRSAISSLEFLCLKGDTRGEWGGSLATKLKRVPRDSVALTSMEKESLEMITQREASLGIFHAVGKIVYNKREDASLAPEGAEVLPPPPDHLRQFYRPKISQVSVNELVDETGTDIQTFICALHENYVPSCEGPSFTDCLDECIEALSDSDILCADRRGAQASLAGVGVRATYFSAGVDMLRQDEISFQVATRGLLFALPHPVKRRLASIDGQSRGKDAYKMFFPTSLRLWSESEKMEGLVDMWMKRSLGPFSRSILGQKGSGSIYKPGGVRSWRSHGVGDASLANREDSKDARAMAVTMVSRDDMLLHQLPYMAKIFSKKADRELEEVTGFRGIGAASDVMHDADLDSPENSVDNLHSSLPLRPRTLVKDQGSSNAFGPRLSPSVEEEEEKLILSDDDIEDD